MWSQNGLLQHLGSVQSALKETAADLQATKIVMAVKAKTLEDKFKPASAAVEELKHTQKNFSPLNNNYCNFYFHANSET